MKVLKVLSVVALLLSLSLSATLVFAQAKIAYVDSKRVLDTYTAAQDAQKLLDEENTKWANELKKLDAELNAKEEELEVQSLMLSEAKKKEKQDEIKLLKTNIMTYQDQKWGQNGEYFRKQEEILRPVYDKIHQVIATVAEDEGYDLVLDTVQGTILYGKEKFDLTDRVISELEKDRPNQQGR